MKGVCSFYLGSRAGGDAYVVDGARVDKVWKDKLTGYSPCLLRVLATDKEDDVPLACVDVMVL